MIYSGSRSQGAPQTSQTKALSIWATPLITALALAVAASALSPLNSWGQNCIDYESGSPEFMGTLDTWHAIGVAVDGDYVYIADGERGFKVIDASDPTSPFLVGALYSELTINGVALRGDYAYLSGRPVRVVDISDPTDLDVVGTIELPNYPADIVLAGDYAYLPAHEDGFYILDISETSSPAIVGGMDTPFYAEDIFVVGNLAYVADSGSLLIIDVTFASFPTVVSTLDTPGLAWGVVVLGDLAYVADANAGLQIVDVSDPATPTIVGGVAMPGLAREVSIIDDIAYVHCSHDGGGGSGFRVVDVSDPESPRLLGSIETDRGGAVEATWERVYVASGQDGLNIAYRQCGDPASIPEIETDRSGAQFLSVPMPFHSGASIAFDLPTSERVRITVHDLAGRRVAVVADEHFEAGRSTVSWDGRSLQRGRLANGIYLLRLESGGSVDVGKLLLAR